MKQQIRTTSECDQCSNEYRVRMRMALVGHSKCPLLAVEVKLAAELVRGPRKPRTRQMLLGRQNLDVKLIRMP